MALPEQDPAAGSFALEADGVLVGSAQQVEGLSVARPTVVLRDGGDAGVVSRLPGRWEAGDVTLTRGLTSDHGFQDWVVAALAVSAEAPGGQVVGREAAVVVRGPDGSQLRRVTLHGAWPSRFELGTDAEGRVVERLTLVCDGLELA